MYTQLGDVTLRFYFHTAAFDELSPAMCTGAFSLIELQPTNPLRQNQIQPKMDQKMMDLILKMTGFILTWSQLGAL